MGPGYFKTYKVCETIIIVLGFFVFLFSLSGYHGPLFLIQHLGDENNSNLMIFTIAEISLFGLGLMLRTYCLMQVWDYYDTEEGLILRG